MLKKVTLLCAGFIFLAASVNAQAQTHSENKGESLSTFLDRTHVGGYGEIRLEDPDGTPRATLTLPRFVIYLDHYFNEKWSFVSETEIENVRVEPGQPGGELALEQAYVDHAHAPWLGIRIGLQLIPVGIINQVHEPPTYFSMQRPLFDHDVIPTTWREMGLGFYGTITEGLQYQLLVSEGLKGQEFGLTGIREGRQEGVESDPTHPALSGRLDYLPMAGLRLGGSFYYQNSTIDKSDALPDGMPLTLAAFDARYQMGGLELRGVYTFESIANTEKINPLLGKTIPSSISGGYIEAGYDILRIIAEGNEKQLIPFVRFEKFDLNAKTEGFAANDALNQTILNFGLSFKPVPDLAIKTNYQILNTAVTGSKSENTFYFGAGYTF